MEKKCLTCCHFKWLKNSKSADGGEKAKGECRFSPPVVLMPEGGDRAFSSFPDVEGQDWCSYWRRRSK